MNENIKKSVYEMEGVKIPRDKEDVPNNPTEPEKDVVGIILHNQIVESTINIIKSAEVEKAMITIGEKMNMDQECVMSFINLMAICMTNSAHQAVLFYDDLLKKELRKQFDNVGNHINMGKADIEGIKAAIQIQQKRLGKLENSIILNTLKKENGIDEEAK